MRIVSVDKKSLAVNSSFRSFDVELNKTFFDFELTENGWKALPPTDKEALRGQVGTQVVVRVIEHGYDNKPDVWYKPQIINLCDDEADKTEARARLEKFGMPSMLKTSCQADVDKIHQLILDNL